MAQLKRFDSPNSFDCIISDDGNLVFASEALAAIAKLEAENERLRTENTQFREFIRGEHTMADADIDAAIVKEG